MRKYDDGFTARMRAEVQREINLNKVDIDYSVFKKSPFEKEQLKRAKKEWKENQKAYLT